MDPKFLHGASAPRGGTHARHTLGRATIQVLRIAGGVFAVALGKDTPPRGGGGGAALNGMRCGSGAAQVLASSAQAKLNSSAVLRVTKMPVRGHRRRGVGMLNEQGLGETQREIGLCHRGRIEQCRARRRRRHALMREGALIEVAVVGKSEGDSKTVPTVSLVSRKLPETKFAGIS